MVYQSVFKRYELKYMLTLEQKKRVLGAIQSYINLDQYGKTTIRNIYFDTDDYRLIRHSIEKPTVYKEKLRIRSYRRVSKDESVFVELKKKYKSVVYKRRLAMPELDAIEWIGGTSGIDHHETQISREIDYFIRFYGAMKPKVLLSYDREAYYAKDESDFRITFDENILCREDNISLDSEIYGSPLLEANMVLMEIKTSGGIPIWMTEVLTRERIFKTPFSKYGTAYKNIIFPKHKGGNSHA